METNVRYKTEYAPKHPSKSKEKQGFGTPVSKKDREAMVRFLVEKPRSGYASWEEYWAAFQRQVRSLSIPIICAIQLGDR